MKASNRVLINSFFLYLKSGIAAILGIYSSRFILAGLGVDDYGIYNVVGGIIGLLGFITATLSNSGFRYIAKSLGSDNANQTRLVFDSVAYISRKVALFLAIALEIVGLIFINFFLKIPVERLLAANIVYQFMIVNTVYSVLTAPYRSLLSSREKFFQISLIEIIDVFIKLGIAISLIHIPADSLITYGVLITLLSIAHRSALKWYCKSNDSVFKDTVVNKIKTDEGITKSLLSFSGWNLLEAIGIIVARQGTIFLINIFFGIAVNAALGLATVVNNQLKQFSSSFLMALQPQIFKRFGKEGLARQEFMIFLPSKMGIILISFLIVPILCEVDYILGIWLIEVPPFTAIFIKLILFLTLLRQISYGLIISFQAHGQIKELQIATFIFYLLNLPVSYTLYKLHFPVYTIFLVTIFLEFIILLIRLSLARKILNLNIPKYVFGIVIKSAFIIVVLYGLGILIVRSLDPSLLRLSIVIIQNTIILGIFSYFALLNYHERQIVKNIIGTNKEKPGGR